MRLEHWFVVDDCESIGGNVYGHPRFEDAELVITSEIRDIIESAATGDLYLITKNNVYELGRASTPDELTKLRKLYNV